MEEIYSRTIHIEEGERSGEYKGSSSRIWEETECRSEKARKVRYGKRKRL